MSIYNKGKLRDSLAKWGLIAVMLLVLSSFSLYSQDRLKSRARLSENRVDLVPSDIPSVTDSTQLPAENLDSLHRADSIHAADSLLMLRKSSLEAPAFTMAKDSIIEDFSNGKQMIYYYGDVSVTYGNMKLTADYMEYDLKSATLYARGTKDTTGVITGMPVMEQGGKSYTMEEVRYNFETNKARITNMVTQEQDGILHGKNIKMMPDRSINMTNGKYTVCECEEPHYYLHLTAAKVMTKPSRRQSSARHTLLLQMCRFLLVFHSVSSLSVLIELQVFSSLPLVKRPPEVST